MINYNYETKNELWDNDYFDFKSSYVEYVNADDRFNTEVFEYVQMMKEANEALEKKDPDYGTWAWALKKKKKK